MGCGGGRRGPSGCSYRQASWPRFNSIPRTCMKVLPPQSWPLTLTHACPPNKQLVILTCKFESKPQNLQERKALILSVVYQVVRAQHGDAALGGLHGLSALTPVPGHTRTSTGIEVTPVLTLPWLSHSRTQRSSCLWSLQPLNGSSPCCLFPRK